MDALNQSFHRPDKSSFHRLWTSLKSWNWNNLSLWKLSVGKISFSGPHFFRPRFGKKTLGIWFLLNPDKICICTLGCKLYCTNKRQHVYHTWIGHIMVIDDSNNSLICFKVLCRWWKLLEIHLAIVHITTCPNTVLDRKTCLNTQQVWKFLHS